MLIGIPLGGTDYGKSGIGTYVRAILPHLATSLKEQGDTLLALGNAQELEQYRHELSGIACDQIPAPNVPALSAAWYLLDLARYARARGVNVLLYPAAQRRCCLRQPLPTVAVVHDLGQLIVPDKYDPLRMAYFKRVALPLIKRATRPVAISESTREHMIAALGMARGDIAVVPNGVDCERFRPLPSSSPEIEAMRKAAGLDHPYILYPARLEHPAKNHVRLIEAFAQSQLKDSHLLALSGADWGAKELLIQTIKRLGLEERVRLLGFVDAEHIPALFAGADAVTMVGLTEGFGLPALEALACGTPLSAANAGALPEVVGSLAAMCDPKSVSSIQMALERSVSDSELRMRAREEGPVWAKRFSWQSTATSLAKLCTEAASRERR